MDEASGPTRGAVKKTLVEQAYELLKKKIVSLELAPGMKIEEQKLIDKLGIGRTPIREALKMLVAEGLVVSYGSNATYVKDLTLKSAKDLLAIIFHLGSVIFSLANLEDDHEAIITDLEEKYHEMEDALREGHIPRFAVLNARFHKILARVANNQYLDSLLERLYSEEVRLAYVLSLVRMNGSTNKEYYGKLQRQHADLIALLRDKDIEGLKDAYREHLTTGQQRLFVFFSQDIGLTSPPGATGEMKWSR